MNRRKSDRPPDPDRDAADKTLPHNLEAERSVLGAIVASNTLWGKTASILSRDDFYRDAHKRIFDAMTQLVESASPIDFITLKNALAMRGDLDDAGGVAYVASLVEGVPKSTNVEHYAAIVKEHKRLRDVIFAANRALTSAYNIDPSADVIDAHVRDLLQIGVPTSQQSVTLGSAVSQYITAFDAASDGSERGHRLGFADVDQFFAGGIGRQQLLIIAARPSIGKTTFAMNVAEYMASQGAPIGFFSLEMGRLSVAETALARNAQIDLQRLKSRFLGERDWAKITHGAEVVSALPIHIVEDVRTYTQFHAWCRRLHDEHHIQVVVIDYIQMMGEQTRDRQQEMAALSRNFKRTAKELDVLMIAISQLSRAPEERKDKRPQLSDLRESGALEQDADVVLLLFRQDAYDRDPNHAEAGTAEIIIAKNRLGPVGVARLAFLREQLRFADLAQHI